MTKIRCAFYGSLRRPMYNYRRMNTMFGANSLNYLRTTDLKGFEMYLVNPQYPGVKHSSINKCIVVDLFDVEENVFAQIKVMEESAGYFEDDILLDGKKCIIFPYALNTENIEIINSGDWLEYVNRESSKIISTAL